MYLDFVTSYGYSSIVSQTPIMSCFYRGGSLAQPHSRGVEDTRWKVMTILYSSMEEGDGDKDEDDGGYEDEHEGGGEDKEDKDDGHDLVEELTPLVVLGPLVFPMV